MMTGLGSLFDISMLVGMVAAFGVCVWHIAREWVDHTWGQRAKEVFVSVLVILSAGTVGLMAPFAAIIGYALAASLVSAVF